MALQIFGIPGSPFVRTALMAVIEKGAPYEFVRMGFGEPRQPEWRERHPFGKIPAFEHDGFRMYETNPFIRYVDDAFDGPPLTPADPKDRFRMNQLMAVSDIYFNLRVNNVISFQRIIAPMLGLTCDEAAVQRGLPDAEQCVRAIEDLIGDGPFLVGDEITLADLAFAPQIDFFASTPEGRTLLDSTRLGRWIDRLRERPSMQATDLAKLMAAA